jgi:hypothetical protein
MPSAGFEHAIPLTKRTQTHALDSAVTGIGSELPTLLKFLISGFRGWRSMWNFSFRLRP